MNHEKFNKASRIFLLTLTFLVFATTAATAQVATGGDYKLEQSAIAGGGGTSADAGNTFSITGSIGQAITDKSSASPFTVNSGFFTAALLDPTAATVKIGGRVITGDGRGIRNVILILNDSSGSIRTATTTAFGYYSFSDVPTGETYIITARSKRFTFARNTQVRSIMEDTDDINFVADNRNAQPE